MNGVEIFVPGRVSLIGGISDLVATYLPQNKDLIPGYAIATTLDKGIYSSSFKSNKFIYRNSDLYFECLLNEEDLKREAEANTFYSYMCGTLLYLMKNYDIGGLELNITKMDLPIKKGLSSSAAICVTVVKVINELYKLNLSEEEIIEAAYKGEHIAQSKCGRLDQATIVNKGTSILTFYEDRAEVQKIKVKEEVPILIVDLSASKNTKEIMNCFNNALPFPRNDGDKLVHNLIGENNKKLVYTSLNALRTGDFEKLGQAFNGFQNLMDNIGEICNELKAPVLHSILNDQYIKSLTFGGKGTGSGGDGTAILLLKDKNVQNELVDYISKKYSMDSFGIFIKPNV